MNEQARSEEERQEAIVPAVDVTEDAGGITVLADLPGVPREALQLHVDADQLVIEGQARLEGPEGMQLTHQELPSLLYRRVFTLSKELDAERVSAELKNGVLRLRIPRIQQAQPRKIRIDVA